MRAIRLIVAGLISALPGVCGAVLIDDFSEGPITVATSGVKFNTATGSQTGLATEHVALGNRNFSVQQASSVVSLTVDTTGDGQFVYNGPVSAINTTVRYLLDGAVDLTAGGANHLV